MLSSSLERYWIHVKIEPVIVVDRGPWYRWTLNKLGIRYFHETFSNRNKIERWFRELKDRTKSSVKLLNINSKTLKSIVEITSGVALIHNILRIRGGNTNLTEL